MHRDEETLTKVNESFDAPTTSQRRAPEAAVAGAADNNKMYLARATANICCSPRVVA